MLPFSIELQSLPLRAFLRFHSFSAFDFIASMFFHGLACFNPLVGSASQRAFPLWISSVQPSCAQNPSFGTFEVFFHASALFFRVAVQRVLYFKTCSFVELVGAEQGVATCKPRAAFLSMRQGRSLIASITRVEAYAPLKNEKDFFKTTDGCPSSFHAVVCSKHLFRHV